VKSVKPAPAKPGKMEKRFCDQDCVDSCWIDYQTCLGTSGQNPDDCQFEYNVCD
jgi:hypothetical protein